MSEVVPGLFVAILDANGKSLFEVPAREPGDTEVVLDVSEVDLGSARQTVNAMSGEAVRVRVDGLPGNGKLIVGQSLHEEAESRSRLLAVLLIASGAAVAVVLVGSWWLVRLGLRPLRAVESSAAAITESDLGELRVPGSNPRTEVGSLALAINQMLERLDRAREEREKTVSDLEASEARMRQFVADASHELRTPLAATTAYAELFGQGAKDHPEDLDRSMSGIISETRRMSELVNDLLLLAQLDERRPLAAEEVDLTEIVLNAMETARALDPDRVYKLKIDSVVNIEGDPTRLRQVVDNLLSNVRTHTPTAAPCEVLLGIEGDSAVLVVRDRGPGVSDHQLQYLGNRFFRVDDSRTRDIGGSGLGLSIAKAIVEAHGGSIAWSHTDPTGITATVRLPGHGSG
jgi:two-component system OmpR family sensor kinase